MNANIFHASDYEVEATPIQDPFGICITYAFTCKIFGTRIQSFRSYTTQAGARTAGTRFVKKVHKLYDALDRC